MALDLSPEFRLYSATFRKQAVCGFAETMLESQ